MQCNAYKCNSTNLVPRLPNNEWWVLAVSQSAQSWQAVNYRTAGQRSCEQLIKWVMQQLFNLWSCKWAKTITHCLQTMIQGQCSPWNGKLLGSRKFYISSVIYIEKKREEHMRGQAMVQSEGADRWNISWAVYWNISCALSVYLMWRCSIRRRETLTTR